MKISFWDKIEKFNKMYKLPANNAPTDLGRSRLIAFKSILLEEISEIDKVIADGESFDSVKVDLADWLGDIIVYCASEALRWGLPLEQILEIIMESNFSKLDENGQPIYDSRGKVMKGPNYWKPEQKIEELLNTTK